MEDIFGSVYNFPGPVPATAFKDFIRRHDYEADHFFSAYPQATSNDVAGAVELKRAMDELCRRPDGNAFAFAAAWRELLTKAQGWL
jgi:hypothetical protein